MTIKLLNIFVTTYTLFAIVAVIFFYIKKVRFGMSGVAENLNSRFAGRKSLIVFELYSWLIMVAWGVLALMFIDLVTFQFLDVIKTEGFKSVAQTPLGVMDSHEFEKYFLFLFFNILGVKATFVLGELARMLKKGEVEAGQAGILFVFRQKKKE